jgi:hypothetical protein
MQMFFDGHYPTLPEYWICSGAEPRHIPKYSAVYIIVDRVGVVKYVGQTTNLQQRYKCHVGRTFLPRDKIGWIQCEVQELLFMECWFIATLRPWINANQNKRAAKAMAKKSARLDVSASKVWKCGRFAEVVCGQKYRGRIEELNERGAKINGQWWPRTWVRVTLP